MQGLKIKLNLLQILLVLYIFYPTSLSQETNCGGIKTQSLLKKMTLRKYDNLYYRTSIGLFQISSIDYSNKFLTVSHSYCSSSSNFISPHHLSAGFPNISVRPNSLILWNCKNQSSKTSIFACNNRTKLSGCHEGSCSVIDDVEKLRKSFHPKDMSCTHYSRVYRSLISGDYELGTRISFDIPDHVPNPCDECEKKDGNCGVGLRCVCHPRKCKDKVISSGAVLRPWCNIILYLVLFILIGVFRRH